MTEDTGTQVLPTYFANIVSTNVTVDEVVLELRRYFQPHTEFLLKPGAHPEELIRLPPPTPAQVFAEEPIARIVLTYSAAQTDYPGGTATTSGFTWTGTLSGTTVRCWIPASPPVQNTEYPPSWSVFDL